MPENVLRAIFFDIDDTLFSTSEFAARARRRAVEMMIQHGLKMDPNEALRELTEVIAEFTSNYPNHFDKLLLRIPETRYAGVNPALLVASGVVGYHNTKKELSAYPDVLEALEVLSRTDLILGVITAGLENKQAEKLIRLGIVRYLTPTAIFISDQIGISKPNIKLYRSACAALGLDPRTVMYIGDDPVNDIDPPNRLGMVTVRNRRGSRHAEAKGETEPRYEIRGFHELLDIVERDFNVRLMRPRSGQTGPGQTAPVRSGRGATSGRRTEKAGEASGGLSARPVSHGPGSREDDDREE